MSSSSGKYLTLYLGQEEYGIEILRVQEIIAMMPITEVPRTEHHVCGVVNLRGKIIRVIDLRAKLGLSPVEETPNTCIIFVDSKRGTVGLVVDRVSEVVDIPDAEVEPPPDLETTQGFLLGMAKSAGEKVRLLLNINVVIGGEKTPEGSEAA